MNLQAPEKQLIKIYPRSYKMTAILLGIGLVFLGCINWKKFDLNTFDPLDHIQIWILLIVFVYSLFPRLIITSQRISYTFGPFFKFEIKRAQVEDIYISPPAHYLRFTQTDTIWTKPLFGKARHPNTPEYWYKNGILNFKHAERFKSFRQVSLKKLGLMEYSNAQTDEIVTTLKHYWQFEADRVEISPVDRINPPDDLSHQDIGNSVVALIFMAILMGFIGFLIPISFLDGLHFLVESYLYLIPLILTGIAFCYAVIKREKKNYPFVSALIVGSLWGLVLYFTGLQINRVYSEHHAQTIAIPMTLSSYNKKAQVWALETKWQKEIGLTEIYVHQNWEGYNINMKQGQSYVVTVKKGLFQDYFLDKHSFKLGKEHSN